MSLVKLLNWGKSLGSSFSFTSIAVLISSVVVLSIYALIVDFFRTFLKVPKHFRHETWKNFFIKPKAGVPTIELGEGGSYREVLARGSQLACYLLLKLLMTYSNIIF
jgi:hypothetical protein